MNKTNLFSLDEAIGSAWTIFKKSPLNIIGFLLLLFVITIVNSFLFPILLSGFVDQSISVVVTQIEGWIVNALVDIAIVTYALNLLGGKKNPIIKRLTNARLVLNVLLGSLLAAVIAIAGFILLIIPGIYFSVRLSYVIYFLIDQNVGPVEAVKKSWRVTKGHFFSLLGLFIVLLLINIFGMLLLLLGLLITIPLTYLSIAWTYKRLTKSTS